MPTPLTAPSADTFDPTAQRTQVRVIGDRVARDFEVIEIQQIQDQRRQVGLGALFQHGGIVREAGGTVGVARIGIGTANIQAVASSVLPVGSGIRHSQQYTIRVATGGVPGVAVLRVTSNGPDNGSGVGFDVPILASDPLDGSVRYAIGTEGVLLAFDMTGTNVFEPGDTWLVSTLHERQLPTISTRAWVTGDPGVGPTVEEIALPSIDIALHGDVFGVAAATFAFVPAVTGTTTIYVELLSLIEEGPLDTISTNPVAERVRAAVVYRAADTTDDALPANARRREVVAAFVWDRSKAATDPKVVRRALDHAFRVTLDQLPGQLGPDALARLDLNEELQGHLALRDHEVFGSYIVEGLGVTQSTNPAASGKVNVMVDAGKARVNGLRVEVAQPTEVELDAAIDVGAVVGEPLGAFDDNILDYPLNKSRIARGTDGFPIAAVAQVLATVAATSGETRSAVQDYDHVDDAMDSIQTVTNATVGGSAGTTIQPSEESATSGSLSPGGTTITVTTGHGSRFATAGKVRLEPGVAGKDEVVTYTGKTGDQLTGVSGIAFSHSSGVVIKQEHFRQQDGNIRWVETNPLNGAFQGKKPDNGTTYTVNYRKSLVLAQGVGGDYQLVDKDGDGALDVIRFNANPPATWPVEGTVPTVNYTYFLKRRDILYLRQDGSLAVAAGIPAENPIARGPAGRFLTLADVLVPPDTAPEALGIRELKIQAVSMQQIHSAIALLDDIRHDLVQQKLLNQITGLDRDFRLADADALVSDAKVDWGFSKLGGVGGVSAGLLVETKVGLNVLAEVSTLGGGHLRLPRTIEEKKLTPNLALVPGSLTKAIALAHWHCLPYTEEAVIIQDRYSESRNINSFLAYSPPDPRIILDPAEDFWISTVGEVYEAVAGSLQFQLTQDTWSEAGSVARLPRSSPVLPGRRLRFDWITQRLSEVAAVYMRPIEVVIRGRHFVSGQNLAEQVVASFDGKAVPLTPIEGTLAGAVPGSVLVAPDEYSGGVNPQLIRRGGQFAAKFTVPPNVQTGIREVKATGNLGSVSRTNFTSFGVERTIHNIAYVTVLRSPLAQTFAFVEDTVLTRIMVPFADKHVRVRESDIVANGVDAQGRAVGAIKAEATQGPLNDPMVLEVREVITPGGYPGPRFFEQVPRAWADIAIGADSENNFVFPDMVMQPGRTFYAVAFRNVGNEYQVYTATMGRRDQHGAEIDVNPNIRPGEDTRLSGVVLDSLNNDYWESPDPNAPGSTIALRCELYRASFSTAAAGAYVYYSPVTFAQPVGYLFLVLQQFTMDETAVACEVSWDSGSTWHEITPFRELKLPEPHAIFHVRARLTSENERRGAFVRMDNATLVGAMPQSVCNYIQPMVTSSAVSGDAGGTIKIEGLVFFEVKPGAEEPLVYMSNGEDASGRPIWEACTLDTSRTVLLPDGWQARQYSILFAAQAANSFTPVVAPVNTDKQDTNRIRLWIKTTGTDDAAKMNESIIRKIGWSVIQT